MTVRLDYLSRITLEKVGELCSTITVVIQFIFIVMRRSSFILIGLLCAVLSTIYYYQTNYPVVGASQVSPYPNPKLTTGVAATLDPKIICGRKNGKTYSQYTRNVSDSVRQQVYKNYPNCKGDREVDHFYPLCAGASNDIENLWCEPGRVIIDGRDWGYHTKDKLEAYVCRQICAGKLDPKVAFRKITTDWVAYYKELNLK